MIHTENKIWFGRTRLIYDASWHANTHTYECHTHTYTHMQKIIKSGKRKYRMHIIELLSSFDFLHLLREVVYYYCYYQHHIPYDFLTFAKEASSNFYAHK